MDHHSADKHYIAAFEYYKDTCIAFGEAAFTQLGEKLMLDNQTVTAVVFGGTKSSMESGAYKAFFNMALSFDLETPLFRDVPPEPDFDCVRNMVRFFEETKPESVVAIGGGSVMDAAKTAYLAWQTGMDPMELVGSGKASEKFPGRSFKRVICVPTTAGTGSEVTPYANIVDPSKHLKYILCENQIVPELALVDPTFTWSMPPQLTLSTALDALTHSVESFLNVTAKNADPDSGSWALESIRLICYALPKVLQNPHDTLAREMLSAAATLGGMAIKNRPTSLPHLCSFSTAGIIPHGLAVALLLTPCWEYYLSETAVQERTMQLAGFFPSSQEQKTPRDVVNACGDFIQKVSGMRTIADHPAFNPELARKIASDSILNPVKLASAPKPVPLEQAESTLLSILEKH